MTTETDFRAHAQQEYPRECCGVVAIIKGKERYLPCRNQATQPGEGFMLHPEDWMKAEDLGEIVAICHSHPDTLPTPTQADLVACEKEGVPWWIVNVTVEGTGDIVRFEPTGYEAPLVGRQFTHGVLDCYSLIRDYYLRNLLIVLPEFVRNDKWWDNGQDLYRENFAAAGFTRITDAIREHDVILMQMRSPVINHGGVYIGDGLILQHLQPRLSSRDVYDGYFQEKTVMVVRHKELL